MKITESESYNEMFQTGMALSCVHVIQSRSFNDF